MSTEYLTLRDANDDCVTLEVAEGSGGIRLTIADPGDSDEDGTLMKFWLRTNDIDQLCEALHMLKRAR